MGVCIETGDAAYYTCCLDVTPYMGVCIETPRWRKPTV